MAVIRIVVNIATGEMEAAKVFYRDLLGMTLAMDRGWIVTLAGSGRAAPQISFAAEGGSGAPVPDLSIEVNDLEEVQRRIVEAGFPLAYGPAPRAPYPSGEAAGSSTRTARSPPRSSGFRFAVNLVRSIARSAATEPSVGGSRRFSEIGRENGPLLRPTGRKASSKRRASARAAAGHGGKGDDRAREGSWQREPAQARRSGLTCPPAGFL